MEGGFPMFDWSRGIARRRASSVGVALAGTAVMAALVAVPAGAAPATQKTLPGSVPSWAKAGSLVGAASPSGHVGFRVYLGWRGDPSAIDQAVSTPGNSRYGHYLSAAQFRSEFSPTGSQVSAVQRWLRSGGFNVAYTPANHLYVEAEGTVARAQRAFGTQLGEYSHDGLTLRSPEKPLSVPASLDIQAVVGLDDSAALVHTDHTTGDAPPSPAFVNGGPCSAYWDQLTTATTGEPTPLHTTNGTIKATGTVTLPDVYGSAGDFAPCGYTPAQLRGAYGLSSTDTGAGQTVAIIDAYASPTIVSDANTFFAKHNVSAGNKDLIPPLDAGNFTQVVAPGTFRFPENRAQFPQGWYGEETLDVEAVHMMAPDAQIVYVGAPNNYQDLDAALNDVVDNHLASMVTNSYGWSGEALPPGYIIPVEDILQQAAAEGIGVYFSSGDSGDETGGSGDRQQATPDWPASSPLVTAVGGTSLAVDSSNARVGEWGWETGNSHLAGTTAKDLSWNPAPPGTYIYGSGGGTSRLFAQPDYQAGVVPTKMSEIYGNTTPMRVVPDVAALGDPNTGMLVGQTQTFLDGTVKYSEYRIGGTSVASPLFTGMMADVQALRRSDIGFANPLLYSQASSAFKDIIPTLSPLAVVRSDYANFVDSSGGYVASVRSIDFDTPLTIHTATGYDDVTGLGSPGPSFFSTLANTTP